MKTFIQQAAEKILLSHGNNLSNVLVLMPNQRSCTYFKNALQQLAERAIVAPEISTLQNWLLSKSKLVLADNIELITLLYNCHQQIGGSLTLDEFIGTANIMLNDFDELDLQMCDSKLFFKNLEMLQSMNTFVPGEELTEYQIKYRKFWEDFGLLYHALREKLVSEKKGYRGMILRNMTENISEIAVNHSQVYFVGFSGLNKTDEEAIAYLTQKTKTEILWDADKYYVNDELQEAGMFFRKHKSKFRISESDLVNEIATREKKIQIIGAAKNIGQVKAMADILQNKLQLNSESSLDTVIVVPDEKLLSPLIAHLPSNIDTVNITMGLSIAGSNTASWFEIIFRLYENTQRYLAKDGTQRFYYKDVFELLQHNFFGLIFNKRKVEGFVEEMKSQNRILIRREEILKALGSEVDSVFFYGTEANQYAQFLSSNINTLLQQLIAKTKKGNASLASEVEITFRILNILTSSQTIFSEGNMVSVKTFIAMLRENFRSERVPLEGDPVQGLQIMGLQETRGLDFKNVIILSANEGILPSGKNTNTYIPYELRREFLTTHKERDANTAYLFYRLFQKAENVFLLYNTEPGEFGGGEKSRFILQMQREMISEKIKIEDLIFAVDPPVATGEPAIHIEKNEEVMKKLMKLLTESGMSPSALNTYINCTLQYYFRYIAGIREQDDMEESLDASTIGSAVHHALEKIYEQKEGTAIEAKFIDTYLKDRSLVENLVREYLQTRFDIESLSRGKNLLLFKVCVKLTSEFLKFEQTHLLQMNDVGVQTEIVMLEEKLQAPIIIHGNEILISGKIDRIEKVGGVIQITDYKTSNRAKKIPVLDEEVWDELMTDPKYSKPVQLLVYAWLYYKQKTQSDFAIRSGIYWLKSEDKKIETLRIDKTNDLLDESTILLFEEKLKEILSQLIDTTIPFSKTKDVERCKFCEFAGICMR
ncbi:MAG: PD-(D/E)XK nuclease family protein [Bacteroidetes bacterium]|nr:PD-(D/E)XK nuclease family protein [Bacteroidota bacterium]